MDWPVALGVFPLSTEMTTEDNTIITDVEVGPKIKRQRYTAVCKLISVSDWHMDGVDFQVLMDFYNVKTKSGALSFNFDTMIAGVGGIVVARFFGQPHWSVIVPASHPAFQVIRVSLDLEVLP